MRNWAEERDRVEAGRSPAPQSVKSEEVGGLRRRIVELERANEIHKTSAAFRSGEARPPTQVMVDYIDPQRESFGVGPARHADPSVTLQVYAHVLQELTPAVAATFAGAVEEAIRSHSGAVVGTGVSNPGPTALREVG